MGPIGLGVVVGFDEHAGYGTLRDDAGHEIFFHCTAIVDGSRTIETGTRVAFTITPGRRGDDEAGAVTVLG